MQFPLNELYYAWEQVRRGSPSPGIDGITTDLFAGVKKDELIRLQQELIEEIYQPYPARGFYLPKNNGDKRLLGIPTVRDRVVQRWLLEEMYLPLEEVFTDCSYAYRPGRGIQMAVKHLYYYYQIQPKWIIKSDIRSFFDSLNWSILLSTLEHLKLDPIIQQLVEQQLKSGIVLNGRYFPRNQGVLQGAVLSGALANLYLSEFDRKCLEKGINLVRYGDDFVAACHSLGEAERTLNLITQWLDRIYLQLHPKKTEIYAPDQEFTFLGYLFKKGQVYAPLPPEPRKKGYPLDPSGMPRRPRPIYIHSFLSQPPKICSLKPKTSTQPKILTNPKHYFVDTMTTLYITDQGSYLKAQGYQFHIFYQRELRCKIPVNQVSHIVLFGCCNITHGAVRLALTRRIPLLYLSQRGRYFGRLETEGQAKVEYLSQQVKRAENSEFTRLQAENIVRAKLNNSRVLLMRLNRRRSNSSVKQAIANLEKLRDNLPLANTMDELRGYEGKAATVYFQALGSLFQAPFTFEKRSKRPPTDPVNSLLSLGYTLLSQNMHSFVEAMGLHTHFGNLHVPRNNHPALVSDLIEEFRAPLVDSLVVYLVNKKIFTPEDFTPPDGRNGVYLHPDSLKKFLKHWEEKLHSEITHPYTQYKVSMRRCLELQVREYIACLMGDTDGYRPMLWAK
ncbi:CRISPR-associated endonuclease Cas1 [Gloeothece verrucosa]|uniref:CRISPR-associated endonuclease Cas1 n=1 Tax=Gloeothece verrucosa (strain PCC 7822) TaxID=497965 RepID=E0UML5_GLOV7|nr:CRISPR-associated endonuclease Cas1 [Gloeothece verrucosa]ADN18195.1 CRISPR-associated protein Cas1 [Gloeothece verrucosa PCC 7822]